MSKVILTICVVALFCGWAIAQTSTSYTLEEHTLNNGGDPQNGVVLTSTSYTITLDAIGDAIAGLQLASASYTIGGGIVGGNVPPGEVLNLMVASPGGVTTLTWDPEPSIGDYNVYRGELSSLPSSYGIQIESAWDGESYPDSDPYTGQSYFYLVTANNRLTEEGTKGSDSAGQTRP
ncbi:MAG TPA: hypothetical protein PK014_08120 [Thermoanaerobaculia bacterium]|nr:hypothetical protein [Thermoanaerobaculia bacterium]HUM30205.1 hypothetical protein [Thermoanaerobaculia bacterium]HXK68346.1 hypothetical protein [Thermoanaerobaculia bacterium]